MTAPRSPVGILPSYPGLCLVRHWLRSDAQNYESDKSAIRFTRRVNPGRCPNEAGRGRSSVAATGLLHLLGLHYLLPCSAVLDETLPARRLGCTRLRRLHPTASAFLCHVLNSPPHCCMPRSLDVEHNTENEFKDEEHDKHETRAMTMNKTTNTSNVVGSPHPRLSRTPEPCLSPLLRCVSRSGSQATRCVRAASCPG